MAEPPPHGVVHHLQLELIDVATAAELHRNRMLPAPAALVDADPRPGVVSEGKLHVQAHVRSAVVCPPVELKHQAVHELSRASFARRLGERSKALHGRDLTVEPLLIQQVLLAPQRVLLEAFLQRRGRDGTSRSSA